MIKKEIGISIYPDYDSMEGCKRKLLHAKELGYTIAFTGFSDADCDSVALRDAFIEVFTFAHSIDMELHVDVNQHVMKALDATCDNLQIIAKYHIPVIRIDCGITLDEIIKMTNNPYGIRIEENLSNLRTLKEKMEAIAHHGNMNNYCACHNYYPRVNSGLSLAYALECAKIAKAYGCKTGAFIGSMYASNDLNPSGKSTMTIEKHRYLPASIQAMELFASECFDFLIFGDGDPREDELLAVSKTTRSAYDCLSKEAKKNMEDAQIEEYKDLYCIQIPVYFESFLKEDKEILESIVMRNRVDTCEQAIRIMNLRGKRGISIQNITTRSAYTITIDNEVNPRYQGEVEILLEDMPAVPYANVIGRIRPYAQDLVKIAESGKVMFQFTSQ